MTPDGPAPATPPAGGTPRRWRFPLLALVLIAFAAGAAGWWYWGRTTPFAADPPAATAEDPEINEVLRRTRQKVVDSPKAAAAWGEYGFVLLAHQFERESDQCFAEAARLDPADPRWPYARARIAIKRDAENAPKYLREALAAGGGGPYRTPALLALGDVLLEQGKPDEAADAYRQVLVAEPNHPRAELGLGQLALARGDAAAAQAHLTQAVGDGRTAKHAHALLAQLGRTQKDEAAAVAHEKAAAAILSTPPWPDPLLGHVASLQVGHRARLAQAEELESEGRHAEAAKLYLQSLERDRSARALVGAGFNLAQSGHADHGLELMREGVSKDPDDARARTKLAAALFARAELEVHRVPGSPRAKPWFEEAAGQARRAAELKPDNAPAYLYWGLCLKYLGDPKGAAVPLRRGVAVRPDDFEMNLALGQVLAAVGETAEAAVWLNNARQIDPKDPRPKQELDKIKRSP